MEKLPALVRLVREISRAHAASEIYEPALSALETIVGVDRSAILLLDHAAVARFVAWRGLSDEYRAAAEGHFPWAPDDPSPRPILIGDVAAELTLAKLLPLFERERIRSLAFIPLVYGDRLVGKFMLYFDAPHVFGAEEVELANAIAYLVAFAIERARLYAVLRETDERKDTFLAMLGHELRNPLASLSAALGLVAARPDDPRTFHRVRGVLDRGVAQIARLVNELLDVSRITRGVIKIEKRPVDLTSVVRHAVNSVQPLITAKDLTLTQSLEPLWLEADAMRLEQVISNLVDNAAKYTPEHGHIRVTTRARDAGVELRVVDDGIGIDASDLPRLFDLFTQVDKSLARSRGGLGIGLTIVRDLVRLHGGTVSAASNGIGQGAEFIVWLPGRMRVEEAQPRDVSATAGGPKRRLLVVEDNLDLATMITIVLRDWGHEVMTVADGPAALAAVEQQHPEIVLLDLGLPGMSGYEVARQIRASGESAVRIVAVSGHGQLEDVARALAAGCDSHLTKPVSVDALRAILAETRPSPGRISVRS